MRIGLPRGVPAEMGDGWGLSESAVAKEGAGGFGGEEKAFKRSRGSGIESNTRVTVPRLRRYKQAKLFFRGGERPSPEFLLRGRTGSYLTRSRE